MKRTGQMGKGIISVLLAVLLGIGLAFTGYVPEVEAAGAATEMANLVIFVKMQGDTNNTLAEKWQEIRSMYDGRKSWTDSSKENSFTDYIATITCGKVRVTNIFPQIDNRGNDSDPVTVFELQGAQYIDSSDIVREVITGIANANPGDPLYVGDRSLNLDGETSGQSSVDNLTIIVQGDRIVQDSDSSFKANYYGDERINGLLVSCYNAITSDMLIGKSVNVHEFLHTLGLPDLYTLGGNSAAVPSSGPVGMWDIMASAGGSAPQYVLGYLRKEMGWLEGDSVAEITTSGTYELTAVSQPDTAGGVRLYTIETPLPQGESQTICLEYRVAMPLGQYDHLIDEGLLMYRVDDRVPDHTNIKGGNYIYVYRPGCQIANDCDLSTNNAALKVNQGGASYGSTDLSAPVSENTLHYSDGSNSGIHISNLQSSVDMTRITFQVDFAEYGDEWQALGGVAANDVGNTMTNLYADSAGNLYLSYINTAGQVCVRRWDRAAGVWQQLGGTLAAYINSVVVMSDCNGQLYLAYMDPAGNPVYSVWNGSSWSSAVQIDTGYPNSLQLLTDGSEVYAAYVRITGNQRQLVIRNLNSGAVVTDDRTATGDFGDLTVVKQGDLFYVTYGIYPNASKIDVYDPVTKAWSSALEYDRYGSINLLHLQGTKLYGFSGNASIPEENPTLAIWNGSSWTKTTIPQMPRYYQVSLLTAGETVYLAYLDSSEKKAGLLRLSGDSFVSCYEGLNGQAEDFQAAAVGDQVFVATTTGNTVVVRCQKVEYEPEPVPPPLPPLTVSLTPPAGYTNADVYIDGIRYTATKSGDGYTLQLPDQTGKTAVMYYYNERNVPKGMYVWRLSYQGDTCTATPLPGLQDLLSYHGFSIRVQGYSGLRFKSGIDAQTRAQLLGGGVNGYHLVEYGTLLITGSNMQKYPFIKDGEKVGGGRSYWTENGVVNDRIFETVDGRYRFASVVTKLPQQQYATELAFRGYAILQSEDGEQLIIYGPPVARSIYTVAKQVLAAGEFKPGSNGYNYVKGIVDVVEGR